MTPVHDEGMDGGGRTAASATPTSRAALYDGFAVLGKALSAGRRLKILHFLNQAPRSVGQLADELTQSIANTSQHLQVLIAAGLVLARRSGQQVIYSLSSPAVGTLLTGLRELAVESVDGVHTLADDHLGERADLSWIRSGELARRIRAGTVIVIDLRSRSDYEAGHIAGAVFVPPQELAAFAESVPDDVEIVAYLPG